MYTMAFWILFIFSATHLFVFSFPVYPRLPRSCKNSVIANKIIETEEIGINVVKILKKASILFSSSLIGFSLIPLNPALSSDPKLFNEVWTIVNDNFYDSNFDSKEWNSIKEENLKKLSSGADEHELIVNMLSKLGDKYSRIIDKKYLETLWKFDAVGVGLIFQSFPDAPMVVSAPPLAGSSSEKAGFKKNDIILSVNGISTEKMTAMEVLDMMSNNNDDYVTLVYAHSDNKENRIESKLFRAREKVLNPVTSYFSSIMPDNKRAGYIRLKEFNAESVNGIIGAINNLEKEGVEEYVLDLRGNTGGGFQFALNIGGLFMDDKPIATAVGKSNDKLTFRSSHSGGTLTNKPLVVWVDGLSASASEVLSGGLHDNCRGVLVGSKTFGKGKIQAVFGLTDGEGLTLTVAQYVTPKGTVIQSKGLEPDIPIDTISPYLKLLVDPLLAKPDITKIDFAKAKGIVDACKPVDI